MMSLQQSLLVALTLYSRFYCFKDQFPNSQRIDRSQGARLLSVMQSIAWQVSGHGI